MAKTSLDTQVAKRLKRHKREVIMLWFIIAMGAILVPIGIRMYFYAKGVGIFAEVLSIVFSMIGAMVIGFAYDRLSLTKDAHRMALFIKKHKENAQNK